MELASKYVEIQEYLQIKKEMNKVNRANKEGNDLPEVDLGDLIERLKIQIDFKLGR